MLREKMRIASLSASSFRRVIDSRELDGSSLPFHAACAVSFNHESPGRPLVAIPNSWQISRMAG